MRTYLFLLLFSAARLVSGQSMPTMIRLEKTPCFWVCPAYTVDFYSSGKVVFRGIKDAVYDGTIFGRLPKAEWNRLMSRYRKIVWKNLPSSYKVKTYDVSKTHFSVKVGNKVYRVRNADDGPEVLQRLGADLVTLWGKKVVWNKKSFVPNETIQTPGGPAKVFVDSSEVQEGTQIDVVPVSDEIYNYAEQMPEFPGGMDAMMSFIRDQIRYPELAKEAGVQGKVICQFVVEKDGKIAEPRILRGIGSGCDEEAIRVIKAMPAWTPGRQNGQFVRVRFNMPISFKLQ